jgi:hypothetical protein
MSWQKQLKYTKKPRLTAVWQNGGFSAKLKFSFQKKFSSKLKVSASKSATSPSCGTLATS